MILLDLFCGRWGWSRAFAKRGWKCIGVDLTEPPEVPENCEFWQRDILEVNAVWGCAPDAIVASPPCEEFSVHGMKHFHPNPKYPANGIRLFEHTRALCEASGLPYVIENVRAAQQFVGTAKHHCGPFYLWGNAVPPLVNLGITKAKWKSNEIHGRKAPGNFAPELLMEKSQRKAKLATIPPELANTVAEFMERLIELRDSRGVQAGYASLSEEQQNTPPHEKHSQYSGNPGNGPVIDLAGGASRFTTTSRSHAEPRGLY